MFFNEIGSVAIHIAARQKERDMAEKKKLTTVAGAPVVDNQNIMTAR